MRDAGGYATRQHLKSIYTLLLVHIRCTTKYSFKPIGTYKCFLNADVWHNLWHPALGQEIFCQPGDLGE